MDNSLNLVNDITNYYGIINKTTVQDNEYQAKLIYEQQRYIIALETVIKYLHQNLQQAENNFINMHYTNNLTPLNYECIKLKQSLNNCLSIYDEQGNIEFM